MKEFKAGDFTSGKMGEIFKECYMNDIAVINHKQFGKSYMVPDVFFKELAKTQLLKSRKFKMFASMNFGSEHEFRLSDDDSCFQEIEEYFGNEYEFNNWFDVLNHSIIKAI